MLFRYKCGRLKEIKKNDFLNDVDYYRKILEIKSFLHSNDIITPERDKLVGKIMERLKY
jgi:hypothetical protein